jgi:hypothetical protein
MSTRAAGALSALSLSLLLLLASSSSSSFSSSLVVVAATDSLARGHFSVDARDVLVSSSSVFSCSPASRTIAKLKSAPTARLAFSKEIARRLVFFFFLVLP